MVKGDYLENDVHPSIDPKEQELVRKTYKMFTSAKQNKALYDKDWIEYYKFFRGDQWKERRPIYRNSEVLNYVFSAIQTIVPIMTDNRPNIETQPQEPSDLEFSEIMTQILRAKWDKNNWNNVVSESIVDMCIYGTAIFEVAWDEELDDGLGDYTFKTVDPFYFFPDPDAPDINDPKCKYVITAIPTDIGEVKKKYPDKAHLIKPDLSNITMAKTAREDLMDFKVRRPTDDIVVADYDYLDEAKKSNQVLVTTCWLKDDTLEEIELAETNEGKVEKRKKKVKKFPNGRKIVIANGVLLEDVSNPYIDGKFPFAKYVDYILPREFWGQGEIETLQSPQRIINKLISYIMDVLILMGNPIWVVDTSSGIDTDNLFNIPGAVIEKNPGTEVRREAGVQLQPFVFNTLQYFTERVFSQIAGVNEVSQGARPMPDLSGVAIQYLQEANQTKLRLKARNLEGALKDAGELMVSRILQFYTDVRVVRITDNQGATKYFKFSINENLDESGLITRTADIQKSSVDPDTGEIIDEGLEEVAIKGNLDIIVSTGTTLPFAKAQKSAQARQLFVDGVIDAEEYLKAIDYPNREKIVDKLNKKKEEEAMAMAQGAGEPQQPNMLPIQ